MSICQISENKAIAMLLLSGNFIFSQMALDETGRFIYI
jgi:hypothetical protein